MTHKKMKLRASETMRNGHETVTISFWAAETYRPKCAVETVHSDVNKGIAKRPFDSFASARDYYLRMVGALYCDGWR